MRERERERERERDNIFVWEKNMNGRKWQIYSKRMRIRIAKIKEDKGAKLYAKLKSSKRNMYRQYLIITLKLK